MHGASFTQCIHQSIVIQVVSVLFNSLLAELPAIIDSTSTTGDYIEVVGQGWWGSSHEVVGKTHS